MAQLDEKAVHSRYRMYKTAQKKAVQWLADTAASSAQLEIVPDISQPPRKSAPKSDAPLRISTRQLVSFAEVLAKAKCTVPAAAIKLFEEIIEGRQACADWYAVQPNTAELEKENEGHQLFIEALKRIHALLTPLAPVPKEDKKKPSKKAKARATKEVESDLSNLFAQLEVEEPSESPLGDAPKSKPIVRKPEVELEQDKEDDSGFRLFCFLQDAKDVRNFIKEIWKEYAQGEVSMLAASVTTEAGIGLLRVANAELATAVPTFNDWCPMLEYLSIDMHIVQGNFEEPPVAYLYPSPSASPTARQRSQSSVDLVDLVCPAAAYHLQVLKSHMASFADMDLARTIQKGGPMCNCTAFTDAIFDFPRELINRLVPELFMWNTSERRKQSSSDRNRTFSCCSELVEGILDYCRSGKLPIWLVLAFDVYMEIYETIGSKPAALGQEYLQRATEMIETFEKFMTMKHAPQIHKDYIERMKYYREDFRWWKYFLRVDQSQQKRYEEDNKTLMPEGQPLMSLRSLPCTAGVQLYKHMLDFHSTGVAVAAGWGILVCMAQLYNAGRKLGLITAVWNDMELIIAAHKAVNRPLVNKSSGDIDASSCLKHFLLALGVPAKAFANGKIPDKPTVAKILIPVVTPQLMLGMAHHRISEDKAGFSRGEMIESVLTALTHQSNEEALKKSNGKPAGRKSPPPQYTPLQLLKTFKKHLKADEALLNFDYISFWRSCVDILQEVRFNAYGSGLESAPPGHQLPHEFVYDTLASHAEKSEAHLKSSNRADTPLEKACYVMTAILDRDGNANKFSSEAYRRSSGRIPKESRPKLKKYDEHPVSPMFIRLAGEPTAFVHYKVAHNTIYDPNGSWDKCQVAYKIQSQFETALKKNPEAALLWFELYCHFAGTRWRACSGITGRLKVFP